MSGVSRENPGFETKPQVAEVSEEDRLRWLNLYQLFFIKILLKSHFSETVQIWRCKIAENLINVLQYCTVQYNTVQYSIVQYKVLPDKHKEYTYEFQGTDLKYSCS